MAGTHSSMLLKEARKSAEVYPPNEYISYLLVDGRNGWSGNGQ
jgi:hypothetical protein